MKKVFIEISQNSQVNIRTRVSFLIKLQAACNFIEKETLAQVCFCEFYEISKNTFFHRAPLVADSDLKTCDSTRRDFLKYKLERFGIKGSSLKCNNFPT